MANLFVAKRGTLILQDPDATGSIMSIDGMETFSELMMVSQIRVERNQVTQYLKTLDKLNFGYAWGEGPGSIIVSGIVFFIKDCAISEDGPKRINDYYNEHNVYNNPEPINISIGAAVFKGYLEKLQLQAEQNAFNFGSFSLQFTILPIS